MEELCLVGGQVGYPGMSKMSLHACIWCLLLYSKQGEWDFPCLLICTGHSVTHPTQNGKNLSPELPNSLHYEDLSNFIVNPDCYEHIFLVGEFSHKPTLSCRPTCPSGTEYLHHCPASGVVSGNSHLSALGGKSVVKPRQQAHSVDITWLILPEANEGVFTGAVLLSGSSNFQQKSSDVWIDGVIQPPGTAKSRRGHLSILTEHMSQVKNRQMLP